MEMYDGDLIGFSGKGLVADVINLGTYAVPRWGLSHIGVVCSYQGEQYIFESTTLNGDKPCAITGEPIAGVQAHPIEDILARPGKVWHYPLRSKLYFDQSQRLREDLISLLGREYDMKGALRSGGCFLRILETIFRKENLSTLFCSELVAHVLTKVGIIHVSNVSGQSPNSLVRRLKRNGITRDPIRLK